jgi:2-phosphosulfolactate phosphatase
MSGSANITEVITLFTPAEMVGIDLKGSIAIVIDVLRGSSTLIRALKAGAAKIIPADEIEEARSMADEWPTGEYLLCAERNGVKVDGFSLGNSPVEYEPETVSGKDLIYSSTNCSKALLSAYAADRVLVGGFNNISAIMETLMFPVRVALVCAGKMGRFALEDAVCAGMFVNEIIKDRTHEVALNDASRTAKILFDYYHRDLLKLLRESSHGNYLIGLGKTRDLEIASMIDSERVIPELSLDKTYFFATYVPKTGGEEEAAPPVPTPSFNSTAIGMPDGALDDFEISEVGHWEQEPIQSADTPPFSQG